MSCNNKLYIIFYVYIILIFILIISNHICKSSYKNKESFSNIFGFDKNSMYVIACIDDSGNINEYYIPGDGSIWSNAVNFATGKNSIKPDGMIEFSSKASWSDTSANNQYLGIKFNKYSNIFANMDDNHKNDDDANSFGGGTNSTESVINLKNSDINTPGFKNNCTKEEWYLYLDNGANKRDYIYAVFKRQPYIDNLTCCSTNNIQRNACNIGYEDIHSIQCNDYMKKYCSTKNNITNDICKNWCLDNKNSDTCKNYQITFCNSTNFKDNVDFCQTNCENQKCDIGVTDYCKNNLNNNNFCACFLDNAKKNMNSSLISTLGDLKLAESDPVCYSSQCRNGSAYLTQTMKDSINGCPKCLQKMTLTNLTKAEDIKQSCTVNLGTNTSQPVQQQPVQQQPVQQQPVIQLKPSSQQLTITEFTLSDYLDQLTIFLNNILDNISRLFNN